MNDFEKWRESLIANIQARPMFPGDMPETLRDMIEHLPVDIAARLAGEVVRKITNVELLQEFPLQEVLDGAAVIVAGFLP